MTGSFHTDHQSEQGDLKKAIEGGAFLVDVRTPAEFAGGSVVDVINIPLDELTDRLEEFHDKIGIVVFCRSGARSESAKEMLNHFGIENVLNGGAWQNVNRIISEM